MEKQIIIPTEIVLFNINNLLFKISILERENQELKEELKKLKDHESNLN